MFRVHNSGALRAVGSLARLELQLGLVVSPGAVGQGDNSLAAVLQTQASWLEGYIMDEVALRVVAHR